MDNFISTKHREIYSAIDPIRVTLPSPFVVCIIGASSGIGEHIAYAYAKAGASGIIISSRKTADLQRVAAQIHAINAKTEVEVVSCDISSSSDVEALAAMVKVRFGGRLDVVVPNSGYAGPVTLRVTEGQPEWFQQNFDVNIIGTYNVAHYFVPLLLSSPGGSAKSFLCIGSFAAGIINGPIANTGYCLSKFAQSRFIEYLGEQFGEKGLFASVIHPGAVLTPMAEGNTPEVFLPYLVDSVDLCGGFCVWLSKHSSDLKWLTGRLISATWDVDEILAKKEEILGRNMLKWKFSMT